MWCLTQMHCHANSLSITASAARRDQGLPAQARAGRTGENLVEEVFEPPWLPLALSDAFRRRALPLQLLDELPGSLCRRLAFSLTIQVVVKLLPVNFDRFARDLRPVALYLLQKLPGTLPLAFDGAPAPRREVPCRRPRGWPTLRMRRSGRRPHKGTLVSRRGRGQPQQGEHEDCCGGRTVPHQDRSACLRAASRGPASEPPKVSSGPPRNPTKFHRK